MICSSASAPMVPQAEVAEGQMLPPSMFTLVSLVQVGVMTVPTPVTSAVGRALIQTLEDSPMVRDAYTALLRRRQLEERAEIESIFALYDFDASGTVSLADLSAALVASGWQEARLAPLLQQLKSGVETRPDALREEGVGAGGRKENGTKVGVSLDAFLECVTAAQAFKSRFSA